MVTKGAKWWTLKDREMSFLDTTSQKVLLPSCKECDQQTLLMTTKCQILQGLPHRELPHLKGWLSWTAHTR